MELKLKRQYLTSDELTHVINSVEAATDEFSKEILKVALVAQILVEGEDWDKYEVCNDIYDKMMEQDDICLDCDVKNFYVIDEIIKNNNSLEKVVGRFLNDISAKIDDYAKLVDTESLKGLLVELKELQKEDEKELVVE